MQRIFRKPFLICLLATSFGTAGAQFAGPVVGNKYSAFSIPDSLKKDADVVMREDFMNFKVKDIDNATLEVHSIATILNEAGNSHLHFNYSSDKFNYLDDAQITVYNAMGTKMNTYSKKEMQNSSYGEEFVDDGKVTYFNVTAASYPITVEINYTAKFRGTLGYPSDYIQSPYVSVENFNFSVSVPTELGLRYRVKNIDLAPQVQNTGSITSYTWQIKNLKAKKAESHSGGTGRYFPQITLAPNKFKMDQYEGDMTSWKNFGLWSYNLIGDNNQLSAKSKAYIQNLVKDADSDRKKIELIYRSLQKNMRYVSIQLGIGVWRPFPADFVQEKKYGDCKALSNYMQSALSAVGIKSYYGLVNAGNNVIPPDEDFPANQFNHIIVCVPQNKDSIWLECTSTTNDFGELGDFTENRKALLITENGGVLVSTPTSKSSQNIFSCRTVIKLNDDGSATADAVFNSSGEFKQTYMYYTYQRSEDEKRNFLIKNMEWKHPDALSLSSGSRLETPYSIDAKMEYEQLPSFKAGSKMFLQPRLYKLFDEEIPESTTRLQDYYFPYPYRSLDTTVFQLPEGFGVETLPKEKKIEYSFGQYTCRYTFDTVQKQLQIVASLEINQRLIKAADYANLLDFKKKIDADMNEKIVVKKM